MKRLFIYSIFILAFAERVWFDLGPNIELITLATIMGALYLTKKETLLLTLLTIAVSDIIIGNSNIFLFTWTGLVLPLLAISLFDKFKKNKIVYSLATGISYNLFFFVWTNLGVWLLDSWGMYPNTALGLIQSYINGLPFLKYQLTSTLFFVPLGIILSEFIFNTSFSKLQKFKIGNYLKFSLS